VPGFERKWDGFGSENELEIFLLPRELHPYFSVVELRFETTSTEVWNKYISLFTANCTSEGKILRREESHVN